MQHLHLDEDNYDEIERFPVIHAIDDDAILSTINIARLIGVHEETVRRWCRNGYLKCLSPFGRYKIRGSDFKLFAKQWYSKKNEKHHSGL
ncbi:DNA-directed RNA polymerase specialized sigma54-like protein [Cytobacillus horneckiae]|uniref:helix-turn-helix domain-containing protein n=2 Tax=Bacillaceae TaxID=186817 RepID=UPI0019D0261D|nr:helix-turn-helix domain-containing protein [Cytobacillus horneckiae]MBN6889620.1 helix-turn-helix domain-containing protein [Cytobacillus horneckiae]MCM3180908.1 helix-turn-helix domain-containing protein [Cytobacillus horneckiae]